MKAKLKALLSHLPHRFGVYLMKNAEGKILYVGKSVDLKNRVNSYFNGKGKLNAAKSQMVGQIADIDTIETANELEALVLETNLIKKHRPKYNILMKDDKDLAYIVVSSDPIPEVYKTRQKSERGTYFGPYPGGTNTSLTISSLRKIFKIRACRMKFSKTGNDIAIASRAGRSTPCMDYYIGLCPAPCLLEPSTIEAHQENVDRLVKFLRGATSEVTLDIETKMKEKAKALEFEEAAKLKELLESIKFLAGRQVARDTVKGNLDAVVLLEKYGKRFIGVTSVRNGEISGVVHSRIEVPLGETDGEILERFLAERYLENPEIDRILLDRDIADPTLVRFLSDRGIAIKASSIQWGTDLIAFTRLNLLNFAYREEMENLAKKTLTKLTMASILEELGYEVLKSGPITFECYDNSHLSGQFTVASRSVIVNGKSDTKLYRKYTLKTLDPDKIDDFESMREIMERRTIEGLEQGNFPTMIILDGGKGQLSSGLEGVDRGIRKFHENHSDRSPEKLRESLPRFCALAKREEEVFLPDVPEPVRFDRGSPELMLLQKIRDEAHRFAISFNRAARSKSMKKNLLEELPGFGPTTRRKLLSLAGSIDAIRTLSEERILSVCTKSQLQTLKDHGIR